MSATDEKNRVVIYENEAFPYYPAEVNTNDLYSDRYQRPLNENWLKKAADDFDPAMLGTIIVSDRPKRGKRFSVIDGQHRVELCKRCDQPIMLAIVFADLTIAQEATLFSRFQRERRGISAFERFQADLIAGNPQSQAVDKLVREAGLEMSATTDAPGFVKCVVAMERVYVENPAHLRTVLTLLQATWKDMPGARTERMFGGMHRFVRQEGTDLDHARFVDRLRGRTPSYLNQKAVQLREGSEDSGGTLPGYLCEAITNAYRSKARRPQ
jgi:hypothetical protein